MVIFVRVGGAEAIMEMVDLMKKAWSAEPNERPTFDVSPAMPRARLECSLCEHPEVHEVHRANFEHIIIEKAGLTLSPMTSYIESQHTSCRATSTDLPFMILSHS